MDLFEASLESARQRAARPAARQNSAQSNGGMEVPFYAAGSLAASVGSQFGLITQSAEQYRHNVGLTYSCVKAVAQRIAGQPVHVAKKQKNVQVTRAMAMRNKAILPSWLKSSANNLTVLTQHPFLDVIENPNPLMPRWSFMYVTVASFLITGKSFWWIYRNDNGDIQIWPLPSHWLTPISDGGKVYSRWKIQPYGVMSSIEVPDEEICFFHAPDPGNPLGSLSTMQAHARSITIDELASDAQKNGLMNGMFPGLAVTVGRFPGEEFAGAGKQKPILTDRQRNDVISAFTSRMRGIAKMDVPIILDGFIEDVKRITNTPLEMAFPQTKKIARQEITQGFSVNPIIMGEIEHVNKASSAAAEDHVAANALNPIINLLSSFMTVKVLPMFGGNENLEAFIEQSNSVDQEAKFTQTLQAFGVGAVTVNELRDEMGLEPVTNGDIAYTPQGVSPIVLKVGEPDGSAAKLVEDAQSEPAGGDIQAKPIAPHPQADNSGAIPPAEDKFNRQYECLAKHISRKTLGKAWQTRLATAEKRLHANVSKYMKSQASSIGSDLRRAISEHGPDNAGKVVNLAMPSNANFADGLKEAMRGPLLDAITSGAAMEWQLYRPRSKREMIDIVRKDWFEDIRVSLPSDVRKAIEDQLDESMDQGYWSDMADDIRERIIEQIKSGIEDGESGADISEKVNEWLGNDAESRSDNITRTEVTGAMNAGHQSVREMLASKGLINGKEWLCIDDDRTREEHADCSGQRVGVDDDFDLTKGDADLREEDRSDEGPDGYTGGYPGDVTFSAAMRCNCRCTSISVFPDDDLNADNNEGKAFILACIKGEI